MTKSATAKASLKAGNGPSGRTPLLRSGRVMFAVGGALLFLPIASTHGQYLDRVAVGVRGARVISSDHALAPSPFRVKQPAPRRSFWLEGGIISGLLAVWFVRGFVIGSDRPLLEVAVRTGLWAGAWFAPGALIGGQISKTQVQSSSPP